MGSLNWNRPQFKLRNKIVESLGYSKKTKKKNKQKRRRHSILSPGLIEDLFLKAIKPNQRPSTREFVTNLYKFFTEHGRLSPKQIHCLQRISEENPKLLPKEKNQPQTE